MKLFNNHSGLSGLPRFTEGIYLATGLSLTTLFMEGCGTRCAGANEKATPPGRHQEQAPKQRCTVALLDPLRSVQFSSVQFRPSRSRPLVHLHRPLPCHAMPYTTTVTTTPVLLFSTMPCHAIHNNRNNNACFVVLNHVHVRLSGAKKLFFGFDPIFLP